MYHQIRLSESRNSVSSSLRLLVPETYYMPPSSSQVLRIYLACERQKSSWKRQGVTWLGTFDLFVYLAIQFFISWVDVYTIIKAQSKALRHIHKYRLLLSRNSYSRFLQFRFLLSRNSYSRFLQFRASQKLYKNVNVEYDPFSLQRKIF